MTKSAMEQMVEYLEKNKERHYGSLWSEVRAEARRLLEEEQEAEPLAVLSYKRGFGVAYGWGEIAMSGNPHQFEIWFTDKGSRHRLHLVVGKTYAECESKARAYLTGLPDKEEGK